MNFTIDDLLNVVFYPVKMLYNLVMSLEVVNGISAGALIVSAIILTYIMRALIGNRFAGLQSIGRATARNATRAVKRSGNGNGGKGSS